MTEKDIMVLGGEVSKGLGEGTGELAPWVRVLVVQE